MPCANYFMACWSAHCNLRSFSSLCGQSGSANYHWTSLDYCLHLHNLTSNTSCNSLFDASVFGPDQPVFPAPTEAKLGTSCTRVSPMELTLTLNWGIKHHSGPWSISLSQIMLSAWLFLSRPPSLRLCYFSHNVFSSPLFFPPAYASIRLSHPASLCSLLHDGSLSSAPPDRPLFRPAVLLFQIFHIRFSSLLLASDLLISSSPSLPPSLTDSRLPGITVSTPDATVDHSRVWHMKHIMTARRHTYKSGFTSAVF